MRRDVQLYLHLVAGNDQWLFQPFYPLLHFHGNFAFRCANSVELLYEQSIEKLPKTMLWAIFHQDIFAQRRFFMMSPVQDAGIDLC